MRKMLHRLLVTLLLLGGGGVDAAGCDRGFLQNQTAAYIAAQTAGQPDGVRAMSSASNFTYTQNFKNATLATGILSQALKIDHSRSTLDTTQCASFSELIVAGNGSSASSHVIGTQMRFTDGELTKLETLVTSAGDWLFNASGTLYHASRESWGEIAADRRSSRAVIQAAADAYLDLFNNKSVVVPWGSPCARLEGGSYVQPSCAAGVPSGIRQINRRYVIDETVGAVDVFFDFAGADPDSHEFRVENGTLRYVHTMTVMTKS